MRVSVCVCGMDQQDDEKENIGNTQSAHVFSIQNDSLILFVCFLLVVMFNDGIT